MKILRLSMFLAVLFMFTNCQKEDEVELNKSELNNDVSSKIVTLDELKNMPEFANKFSNFRTKSGDTITKVFSAKYGFWVEKERVLLTQKGNYHSLSFPVFRSNPSTKMENLFLHPYKGGYLPYLISYDFDDKDMLNFEAGLPISNLPSKMGITILRDFDMKELNLPMSTFGDRSGGWEPGDAIWLEGQCWVVHEVFPDYFTIIVCGNCECSPPTTTSPPSTNNGSGAGIIISDWQYYSIQPFPGGGGGSGGGGGAGGGAGNIFNPLDGDGPQISPGDGGGTGVGNGQPVIGGIGPQINNKLGSFLSDLDKKHLKYLFLNLLAPGVRESAIYYLQENNYSKEAKQAVIDALTDILNENVEYNILNFLDKPCQRGIINDVLAVSSPFTDVIRQTFNNNQNVNLEFTNGEIPNDQPAYTDPFPAGTPESYVIKIKFNNNLLNGSTDLYIAAIALHEMVHAYLINLHVQGQLTALDTKYETLMNSFLSFYVDSNQITFAGLDNEIHNAMADFMKKMADSLYNYAQSKGMTNVSKNYCEKIVWSTMYNTQLFNEVLTQQQQIDYAETGYNEQENIGAKKGSKCP